MTGRRYEGVGYVVVGRLAHVPSFEDGERDMTLCGRPIFAVIDRRGERVCQRCTRRADRLDGVTKPADDRVSPPAYDRRTPTPRETGT